MNGFGSECSSGCESGWTMYLDHSASPNPSQRIYEENGFYCDGYKEKQSKEEEDEEDLSMVSDASSGPPHCQEDEEYYCDENGCFTSTSALAKKTNKRRKIKPPSTKQLQHQQQQLQQQYQYQSLLDDTASSPIYSFSKDNNLSQQPSRENVLDFSQGFSAAHFNERYAFQQSTLPGKSTSAKPVACRKGTGNRIW